MRHRRVRSRRERPSNKYLDLRAGKSGLVGRPLFCVPGITSGPRRSRDVLRAATAFCRQKTNEVPERRRHEGRGVTKGAPPRPGRDYLSKQRARAASGRKCPRPLGEICIEPSLAHSCSRLKSRDASPRRRSRAVVAETQLLAATALPAPTLLPCA